VNVLERGLLLLMPHQRLQGGEAHVLIHFMRPERMPQGMYTDLFPDAGFLDVLGDDVFDGGDV